MTEKGGLLGLGYLPTLSKFNLIDLTLIRDGQRRGIQLLHTTRRKLTPRAALQRRVGR